MTSGTFGPLGTISSRAADLQSSLANRLRARTDIFGSTLFKLTWKVQRTPAGRSFSLLRALAHRTAVTESSTWPTPRAEDSESSGARLSRGVNDTLTAVSAGELADANGVRRGRATGRTTRSRIGRTAAG
jgi:hypothetical protein